MSILDLTAVELGKKIKAGEVTVVEATRAALAQIKALDPTLNSYVTVDEEGALKRAEEIQKQIDDGTLTGPLAGVPVAIKDNMCTEGMLTTCSSKILYNFKPTYTAEAVLNLEKSGAVILGKTNMDEFAMGSTTETSAFGETRNPWNPEHVPGGSSGGSCAAVAANECFYALGSDTGGSIRQPSSFCGVTGIKPTYGTVSRYGLIAYGSSLDQIGPIAKDVTDCAAILEVIASYDKKDSTSVQRDDCDFTSALTEDVKGMKIGIPRDYYEASSLDGASPFQQFTQITLPLLSPTTLFLFITTFISSMKVFQSVDILTEGGPYRSTEVFVYKIYLYAMEDFRMDRASVIAIAFFVLLLIVTVSTFKISNKNVHYDS